MKTLKKFNGIDKVQEMSKNIDSDNFRFRLSTLRAWIRFCTCILQVPYGLLFKTCLINNCSILHIINIDVFLFGLCIILNNCTYLEKVD